MNLIRSFTPLKWDRETFERYGLTLFFSKKFGLKRRSNGAKKGFALITILAVLIMIAVVAATLLQSLGSHTTMKANNLQEVKAQYLAEAGMQYAMWKCRQSGGCASLPPSYVIEGTTVFFTKTLQADGSYKIKCEPADYTNV